MSRRFVTWIWKVFDIVYWTCYRKDEKLKKKTMLKFLACIRTEANKLFSLQINELDFLSIDKRKEQYNSLLLFN